MADGAGERSSEYVTVTIADQLFGLPIARVQDVFVPQRLSPVPLSPPEIAGLLNLRGRIITAIDMRRRLGLPPRADERPAMAASVEAHGECYGLMVDAVDEVLNLDDAGCEPAPPNLDPAMARAATGVHRLDGQLMVVLDVDRVLDIRPTGWSTPT